MNIATCTVAHIHIYIDLHSIEVILQCMWCRLESIMLQNLPIMLFDISPIFCLLCLLVCFSEMHYAFIL